jgi:response regulator RpfG family c-di-GMP phosphodiesterase
MTSGFAESRKKKRGKPCVLIVDDQRSIVKLMERRLAMEGYEVDTAKNGIEALAFMQVRNSGRGERGGRFVFFSHLS